MYRLRGLGLAYPSIDAAIQKFEGYAPGTLAYQNNNPGNLQYASWEAAYGCQPGGAGGFAVCPSYQAGQQIQDALVSTYVSQGLDLSDLLAKWSPPSAPGNSQASYQNYVASVASDTGLDPSLPISQQLSTTPSVAVPTSYSLPDSSSPASDQTLPSADTSGDGWMDFPAISTDLSTDAGGLSTAAWLGIAAAAAVGLWALA